MDADSFLQLERQFWLSGPDFYERQLATPSLMVFPPPAGVLDRSSTLHGLASAPRWTEVELLEPVLITLNASTIALAYVATARRDGMEQPYRARVGSVYVQEGAQWKLAFHQHTPLTG